VDGVVTVVERIHGRPIIKSHSTTADHWIRPYISVLGAPAEPIQLIGVGQVDQAQQRWEFARPELASPENQQSLRIAGPSVPVCGTGPWIRFLDRNDGPQVAAGLIPEVDRVVVPGSAGRHRQALLIK
jgi:hypothetical protein